MTVLQSILAFVLALGILVTIHEFGHYWVAKKLGVKILRFSVGFGRPLWSRSYGPDRTEFVVAAIPLGGYVKMLDEREGEVPASERARAFNRQPLRSRSAIVVAGPLFNFLFAVLAYWLMFVVGVSGLKPIIGEVAEGGPAARAGLQAGYEIVEIEGRKTPTWETVLHESMKHVLDRGAMELRARDAQGLERSFTIDLTRVNVDDVSKGDFFTRIGLQPNRPKHPALIGEVIPGGAAERAGMRAGDRVLSADGVAIKSWMDWVEYVRARPEQLIRVEVQRKQQRVQLEIRPELVDTEDGEIGRIGAVLDQSSQAALAAKLVGVERYPPHVALVRAIEKTWDVSVLTVRILGKMLLGEASVKNLSGPISIAQYAGQSANIGFTAFLAFLAIVSVSLGILNLLPVPLLDGGHLMYYLIELITRRPVSETVQAFGQQVGLVLLLSLMGLAFYNDLMRLL